jgi:2,4-dienoyl-CoA reductase (NADPH2)
MNTLFTEEIAQSFEEIVIATGVNGRKMNIEGENHPKVLTYTDVVLNKKPVGQKVAIVGAGGIGFDVAEFLTNTSTHSIEDFMKEWGVDMDYKNRGALMEIETEQAPREVYLLQRSKGKLGDGLGKTTGWIHRTALKMKKVKMIAEVSYLKIDDAGFHIKIAGADQILEVDNVVVCAGQVSNNQLYTTLKENFDHVHLIGGALEAGDLDAKRAIDQGVRLGMRL